MKKCPHCKRTYGDSLVYCLEDGKVLSALRDPEETLVFSREQKSEGEALSHKPVPEHRKRSRLLVPVIAGIATLTGVLLWFYYSSYNSQSAASLETPFVQSGSEPYRPSLLGCTNLLRNGTLEPSLEGWKVLNFTAGARIYTTPEGAVQMIHNGIGDWNTISQEIRSKLQLGKTYILTVRYKTTDRVKIGLHFADSSLVMHSNSVRTVGWELPLVADGEWHSEAFQFEATRDHPKPDEPMFSIIFDYNNVGTVFIDDVLIAEKQGSCG